MPPNKTPRTSQRGPHKTCFEQQNYQAICTFVTWQRGRDSIMRRRRARNKLLCAASWRPNPRFALASQSPESSHIHYLAKGGIRPQSYCQQAGNRFRPRLNSGTFVRRVSGLANCHWQFSPYRVRILKSSTK